MNRTNLFDGGRLYGRPADERCIQVENGILQSFHPSGMATGPEKIDLGNGFVYPGFIDAHLHTLSHGLSLDQVDLTTCLSAEACTEEVRRQTLDLLEGRWVEGRGWNRNLWENPAFPTREDLDRAAPGNPVALSSIDGHALWVNSAALEIAGINRNTPDPSGGQILRDTGRNPVGILVETAMESIRAQIPEPTTDVRRRAIRNAMKAYAREGITSVHDCNGMEMADDLDALREDGRLSVRFYNMLPASWLTRAMSEHWRTGNGDAFARIGPVKVFTDGALGPNTAAMLEPYEGSNNSGVIVTEQDTLNDIIVKASNADLQVACHAIGDLAVRSVLDAVEGARKSGKPPWRPRIEHAQITHPDDIPRLKELDVIASMQPVHCTSDMQMADRFWGERARWSYTWRSLQRAESALAFGSDCPVESCSVLEGLYAAVTRKRHGRPATGWYPEECVDINTALQAYTIGAAYASGEEDEKGSLTIGKMADFVVLDRALTEIPPEEILQTRIMLTVVGGEVVYDGR